MIVNPRLFASPRSATLISLSIIAGNCRFYISLVVDPAVFHNMTVEQVNGAIGVLREPLVVRDRANCQEAGVQFLEQIHYRFTVAGVEISGRLVREQNRRLARKGARN